MKYCPKCRSSYADDTLKFCLQDGTLLAGETEMPTVSFGKTDQFGDKTEQFASGEATEQFRTDQPTAPFATNKDLDQIRIDLPESKPDEWEQSRETRERLASYEVPPPQKSNTLVAVLATALAMLILFGIAGVGAWVYFFPQQEGEVVKNTNERSGGENKAKDESNKQSPTPSKNERAPKPDPSTDDSPAANFDAEEIKREVSGAIHSWKSASESLNLDAHMSRYADTVDYYNKNKVGKGFVRSDKLKAYTQYDEIEINLSNMRVTLDAKGENATAVFDKAWHFESAEKTSEGKVQSQLKLRKIGDDWKITSEKDLKVYFVK